MANICTTNYIFEGEGKQINALNTILRGISDANPKSDDYHDYHSTQNWLGFVAKDVLGIDHQNVSCRGEFYLQDVENCPYDDDKLVLKLEVSSAWCPPTELFEKVAEKYECSMYWMAEELGCELFQSNDPEGRYFSDDTICVDIDDHGTEYFSTEEKALSYIRNFVKKPNLTWEECNNLEGIYIHEVDYV